MPPPHAAYRIFAKRGFGHYSQFNILCAYIWWHRRDDYVFYVHDTDPGWNGMNDSTYVRTRGEWLDKDFFPHDMRNTPKPYLAAHLGGRYARNVSTVAQVRLVFASMLFFLHTYTSLLCDVVTAAGGGHPRDGAVLPPGQLHPDARALA